MTVLSPPLFMAGLHQYAELAASAPAEDLRLRWSGRYPADLELVHRIGTASHRDPVCQVSWWPLEACQTARELVGFAARHRLTVPVPLHGDLIVVAPDDDLLAGLVGIVLRVEEYASNRREGPTRVQLAFAEPAEGERGWMRYGEVTRWCGPSRGDTIVSWRDWAREAA